MVTMSMDERRRGRGMLAGSVTVRLYSPCAASKLNNCQHTIRIKNAICFRLFLVYELA